jgi:hypothetical protein
MSVLSLKGLIIHYCHLDLAFGFLKTNNERRQYTFGVHQLLFICILSLIWAQKTDGRSGGPHSRIW